MAIKGDHRQFSVDESGNWVNSQPEGSFVGPDLHTAHYAQVQAAVTKSWLQDYTPAAGDVVIDVGAGIGEDALVLSHMVSPNGIIHAIEAHVGTFACLQSTVRLSELINVKVYNLAITESNGMVTISNSTNHLSNSIVNDGSGLQVEGQSLDYFIEHCGHNTIDLLKMNIEGAERGAMLGLSRQAVKIRHIAISCHDFIADNGGDPQFRTKDFVRQRLIELGFRVTECSTPEAPWEADVLFAHRIDCPEKTDAV